MRQGAAAQRAAEAEAVGQRAVEAEKALASVLKAANAALKAASAGREEAKALADALRSGAENAPAAPATSTGGRMSRQSGGNRWR